MERYTPECLQRWTLPGSYMGAHWPDYFVFLGQHRDSDCLTRCNFVEGLKAIGGESDTVLVIEESHWAVGWVQWIAIHQDDAKALQEADEIMAALSDYPVVSDEAFSAMEDDEMCAYWGGMSVRERFDAIKRSGADVSPFSARRDEFPRDDNGRLSEYCRPD